MKGKQDTRMNCLGKKKPEITWRPSSTRKSIVFGKSLQKRAARLTQNQFEVRGQVAALQPVLSLDYTMASSVHKTFF
jgi:hypothetical protein